jgi:hypothetical protein
MFLKISGGGLSKFRDQFFFLIVGVSLTVAVLVGAAVLYLAQKNSVFGWPLTGGTSTTISPRPAGSSKVVGFIAKCHPYIRYSPTLSSRFAAT